MLKPRVRGPEAWGLLAILLWASLAGLSRAAGEVPPVLLTALAFSIAGALGLAWQLWRLGWAGLKQPLGLWLWSVGGLFGYHALYFLALQEAPALEANLLNYLWPLLLSWGAAWLPGGRSLGWRGWAGSALALGGAWWAIAGGQAAWAGGWGLGHLAAVGAACAWACYSLGLRRWPEAPPEAMGGFCACTALLAWGLQGAWGPSTWPQGWAWLAVLAVGLGPLGLAFVAWDRAVRGMELAQLGRWAFATPLLSNGFLVLSGLAPASWGLLGAAFAIVGGAWLAQCGASGAAERESRGHPSTSKTRREPELKAPSAAFEGPWAPGQEP